MQKNQQWPFLNKKQLPFVLNYSPQMKNISSQFFNPFLGYPNCPLIGRYNQGQYRIAQTQCHLQFECLFDKEKYEYKCGPNIISIPQKMRQNLRNIPEVIKHNKPSQSKNQKIEDTHPVKFQILDTVKFVFVITFGQIGKDFLNYLNHMYTLAQDLFIQQKLRRSVFLLPIYAYLPEKSGIMQEEVDKGLNLQNYRSEYLSLHLKYGAPAFSPNNMRLGIQGMKKIQSNPLPKKNKKYKQNQKQKQEKNFKAENQPKQNHQENQKLSQNKFTDQISQQQIKEQKKPKKNQTKQSGPHKGFIHFYTSMLLQNDYRVYYHWHIENKNRQQLINMALMSSNSLNEFIESSANLLGFEDECVIELRKIFGL